MDPEHKRGIRVEVIREWIDNQVIEYLEARDAPFREMDAEQRVFYRD